MIQHARGFIRMVDTTHALIKSKVKKSSLPVSAQRLDNLQHFQHSKIYFWKIWIWREGMAKVCFQEKKLVYKLHENQELLMVPIFKLPCHWVEDM